MLKKSAKLQIFENLDNDKRTNGGWNYQKISQKSANLNYVQKKCKTLKIFWGYVQKNCILR